MLWYYTRMAQPTNNTAAFQMIITAPVKQATDLMRELLLADDNLVIEGLITIYKRQTADEQQNANTTHHNGVGFTGIDAQFGSSLATQAIKRGTLSEKQMFYARKMMKKYAGQLVRIMKEETPAS